MKEKGTEKIFVKSKGCGTEVSELEDRSVYYDQLDAIVICLL